MKHVYEYPKFGKIDLTIAVNELFRMNKVTIKDTCWIYQVI